MDANLIYEKTSAGEEAVRQRTRVVQRNTRMVLILVDGKSSVADLCSKTGNAQLVETALQDLERDGLIAPQLEQDSVWEQSKKLAEEIKAAAVNRLAKEEHPPEQKIPPPPESISPASAAPPPFSIAPLSIFPGQMQASAAPFSTFGGAPSVFPTPAARVVPEEPAKPSIGERLGAFFVRKERAGGDESIKAIRRGARGPYISMPLAISFGIVGLLLLAVLVFVLYPYDSHRPQLEAGLSRMAGQPVQIGEVKATFMPRPSISLERISGNDANGLRVARIRLVPEFFSLLGSHPVFSSVEIESAHLPAKALAALPRQLADVTSPSAPATVHSISFRQLEADVLGLTVGDLNAELRPDGSGKLPPLTFHTTDRALTVVLKPEAGGFVAAFEAYAWRPDAESRFAFDSLQGEAFWDGRSLAIRSLDARIFDGSIQGVLLFSAEGRNVIAGDVSVKRLNLQRFAGALGYGSQFEGEMAGALKFSGGAPTWAGVLPSSTGEGSFVLQRGALGGFDLVEAVRRGKGSMRGGSTRYEQLSGRLTVVPELIRFSDLALSSGVLRSGGYMEVARDGKLAGRLDVEMRGSANVVRMPIGLAGSLKDPMLQGIR